LTVDTAQVPDGTHTLRAVAADAAGQEAASTAVLRVDRTAPAAPDALSATRNGDGTAVLAWTNPDQGTAAPIVAARYRVCDALGVTCGPERRVAAARIARVAGVAVSAGTQSVRVWLEDGAGHSDRRNAAVVAVEDPEPPVVLPPRVVETLPPVLLPSGPRPSPRLRVTRARRTGSTLRLAGTIARGATRGVVAEVARSRGRRTLATSRATPRRGKWSVRVRLTPRLRRAGSMYLTLRYPGEANYRSTTLHRRLARRAPRPGSTAVEFSVETRASRR
jgi:hypothetical protein